LIKRRSNQPDIKINLLCHSAGGLVARYYAKYGTEDVLDQNPLPLPNYAGATNINRIIMLGTPNTGSMEMFEVLYEGVWIPGVGSAEPEIVFTMPGLYQLLPENTEDIFIDHQGHPLAVDIYDPAQWEKYGWSVFCPYYKEKKRRALIEEYGKRKGKQIYKENLGKQRQHLTTVLGRAKRFHEALWNGDPAEEKKKVRYVVLGGNAEPTLRRVVLEKKGSGWRTRFNSRSTVVKKLLYGYGDESVTKESLIGRRRVPTGGGELQIDIYRLNMRCLFFQSTLI